MEAAPQKLVTAILPPEVDMLRLLERLRHELGIAAANLNHARGMGHVTRNRSVHSTTSQTEILSVVVPEARADEVFGWLRAEARIDRPHGGILYMQSLALATHYLLPDLPEEEGEPQA